ncbi:RecQ family ATP-dependent DNA helicase [Microbacterium sp. STN6]|uniref:RecQ family ATP-dependent DNA helicase n=1 Tax=Microbacterium sp. STN6 TaxID=2995588 RepID=UPI002260983D|nr:RecQ family ATP-dependent DNA helicase [Microbacterium sp. STN6]MCX7523132.1 RecQ family ATP-dependent DNA helicase [Microbacterium sp. STN6]
MGREQTPGSTQNTTSGRAAARQQHTRDALSAARDRFGWERLRAGQREAIEALVDGTDVLAVMPTGYGKSAIYQVAALLVEGPTVVVSPLIALQSDQVSGIEDADDAPEAVAVNSSQSDGANERAWDAVDDDDAEFLFLAPEQLAKDEVVERLRGMNVRLFVVDEAHCVSAWGHDFRPDYLRLGDVIARLGHPTTVALTATGSPPVRDEIVERLGMRHPLVLTRGFDRPNIRLEVRRHAEPERKRQAIVEQVRDLPKPGLLYVATRRETTEYADVLSAEGVTAAAYHAGLKASERRETHERFLADELEVVVATSAFGMGIDKPNVRFVVHTSVTDSLESYYQEIGRAGRDGDEALAALHYRAEDLGLRTFFASSTPDAGELRRLFEALRSADGPLRVAELARRLDLSTRKTTGLLNPLQQARVVSSGRRGVVAAASVTPEDAAERASEAVEARERIDRSRIAMMRGYAETGQCRRQFLLGYFGEELDEPCGNCDTCTSGSAYEADAAAPAARRDPFALDTAVRHSEWGEGVVMRAEEDRITVFFESEGYKVLSRADIAERGLLEEA